MKYALLRPLGIFAERSKGCKPPISRFIPIPPERGIKREKRYWSHLYTSVNQKERVDQAVVNAKDTNLLLCCYKKKVGANVEDVQEAIRLSFTEE